jgi:mRNA-degrading endonuclease RelE of RelBE toxin-antitoxin system
MPGRYYVKVANTPRKSLRKIPLPWQTRILDMLTALETDPFLGEKMTGKLKDRRKIKLYPYRIVYRVQEEIKLIRVVEIERRGNMSYD